MYLFNKIHTELEELLLSPTIKLSVCINSTTIAIGILKLLLIKNKI